MNPGLGANVLNYQEMYEDSRNELAKAQRLLEVNTAAYKNIEEQLKVSVSINVELQRKLDEAEAKMAALRDVIRKLVNIF